MESGTARIWYGWWFISLNLPMTNEKRNFCLMKYMYRSLKLPPVFASLSRLREVDK